MNIILRDYLNSDLPFLSEMLYEAVYWRRGANTPSFQDALSDPELRKDIDQMGGRNGDIALLACVDDVPAGAVWLRYWKAEDGIRGYISDDIPILAIAVKEPFRHQGIGSVLMDGMIRSARDRGMDRISLCVSKDNAAQNLYRTKGFREHTDLGHSFVMERDIKNAI